MVRNVVGELVTDISGQSISAIIKSLKSRYLPIDAVSSTIRATISFTPRRKPKIGNYLLPVRRTIPEDFNLQECRKSQVCQTLQLGLNATLQLESTVLHIQEVLGYNEIRHAE